MHGFFWEIYRQWKLTKDERCPFDLVLLDGTRQETRIIKNHCASRRSIERAASDSKGYHPPKQGQHSKIVPGTLCREGHHQALYSLSLIHI